MATERVTDPRFWAKVRVLLGWHGCWEWNGYRDRQGYGKVMRKSVESAPMLTHRYAWLIAFGPIPDGLNVLHHCDNPPCVRPDHLFLGTQLTNMRDRDRKGRHRPGRLSGEAHPAAKLTAADVADIRARYPGETQTALAREYGVTQTTVCAIIHRRLWRAA